MKKITFYILLTTFVVFLISGCNKDSQPIGSDTLITSFRLLTPAERIGVIDDVKKVITCTAFEPETDVTQLYVEIALSPGATVSPASGSKVDFSKLPVIFTVTNGSNVTEYKVSVAVDIAPKIAFIGLPALAKSINEPDTRAAYDFLFKYYKGNLRYLAFKNISDKTLRFYDIVYYYSDTQKNVFYDEDEVIPAIAQDSSILKPLLRFQKAGGHFLLAGHATQYLHQLERLPKTTGQTKSSFGPSFFEAGGGSWDWNQEGINPNLNVFNLNTNESGTWDQSNLMFFDSVNYSDLYKIGVDANFPDTFYYGFNIIPTDHYGYKENHNSMWEFNNLKDLPGYVGLGSFSMARKFETDTKSRILATVGTDTNLEYAAMVEFFPTQDFRGTIIAIGNGSYDWDQSTMPWSGTKPAWFKGANTNKNIRNTQRLTINALNYLLQK
jgi:hypothetical protein